MNEYNSPGNGSEDERLRRLFSDAVDDIEPRDSLDSIRSRTTVTAFRARRPWILGAGAAAVATAATVAAVAVMGGSPGTTGAQDPGFAGPSGAPSSAQGSGMPDPDKSSAPSPDEDPSQSGMSTDESSATSTDLRTVPVYYVGDTSRGPRLFREFHQVHTNGEPEITAALNEALSASPGDADYRTDWPAGTTALVHYDGVGGENGEWTIVLRNADTDLSERPADMTGPEASLAIEQLVYTVQGAAGDVTRSPVQFALDRAGDGPGGNETDTVLGVPTTQPVPEGDPADVLAQVWVIDPTESAPVTAPFKVSGLANAFEANVQWELMQGDTLVRSGFAMADEAFTMAPYSFRVKNVPPGDYTLVVHDEDASGGAEGPGPWVDTKNVTVVE